MAHRREGDAISDLSGLAHEHLVALCSVLPDRRPGGGGNDEATAYVAANLARSSWQVTTQEFACLNWETNGASMKVGTQLWT